MEQIIRAMIDMENMEQVAGLLRYAEEHDLQVNLQANPIDEPDNPPRQNSRGVDKGTKRGPYKKRRNSKPSQTSAAPVMKGSPIGHKYVELGDLSGMKKSDEDELLEICHKTKGKDGMGSGPWLRVDLGKSLATKRGKPDTASSSQTIRRWVRQGCLVETGEVLNESYRGAAAGMPPRSGQQIGMTDVVFVKGAEPPRGKYGLVALRMRKQVGDEPIMRKDLSAKIRKSLKSPDDKIGPKVVRRLIDTGFIEELVDSVPTTTPREPKPKPVPTGRKPTRQARERISSQKIADTPMVFIDGADVNRASHRHTYLKLRELIGTRPILRKHLTNLVGGESGTKSRTTHNQTIRSWLMDGLMKETPFDQFELSEFFDPERDADEQTATPAETAQASPPDAQPSNAEETPVAEAPRYPWQQRLDQQRSDAE